MRKLIIILFLGSFFSCLQAQDPHFSQFDLVPFEMNPGLLGQFDGKWRIGSTYRNQWFSIDNAAGFNTMQLSADIKIDGIKEDYWSVGMSILNDYVGHAKYRNFNAKIGGAYTMVLESPSFSNQGKILSLGSQIGFGQNSIGFGDLWFGRQYDYSILDINTSLDTGEPGLGNEGLSSNVYTDVSLGLFYSMGLSKSSTFNIGIGAFHLNEPDLQFIQDRGNQLTRKFLAHADVDFYVSNQVFLNPFYLFSLQSPFSQHQLGTRLVFENLDEQLFGIGISSRITSTLNGTSMDAVILQIDLSLAQYKFGLSYDFTVSSLAQATNNQGAFEMHLIYFIRQD